MKWFFAYNGLRSVKFDTHIKVMIRSALANTSLEPHLLYFGDRTNPILAFLEDHGVKVIHHTPSILPDLERIATKFPDYRLGNATGAFMRIDLPRVCRDLGYGDQFILYTDLDVVFLREIPDAADPSTEPFMRPTLFSCAPETSQTDWSNMNSGVMVMNVDSLCEDFPAFKRYLTSGDTLYHVFDQKAYRLHYTSKWDKLPLEYNWKPYWGFNEDALIVHFHGPKIHQVRAIMDGKTDRIPEVLIGLFKRDPEAYDRYLAVVEEYAAD